MEKKKVYYYLLGVVKGLASSEKGLGQLVHPLYFTFLLPLEAPDYPST